jgi:DNA-binding CsgD family transcriptional regulator
MRIEPETLTTVAGTLESLESALANLREAVGLAELHLRESRQCYQRVVRLSRVAVDSFTPSTPGSSRLTRQELRVAMLVAEGKSNLEVAARHHLSVHTVKSHVKNILRKLNLQSRWQLREALTETGTSLAG